MYFRGKKNTCKVSHLKRRGRILAHDPSVDLLTYYADIGFMKGGLGKWHISLWHKMTITYFSGEWASYEFCGFQKLSPNSLVTNWSSRHSQNPINRTHTRTLTSTKTMGIFKFYNMHTNLLIF